MRKGRAACRQVRRRRERWSGKQRAGAADADSFSCVGPSSASSHEARQSALSARWRPLRCPDPFLAGVGGGERLRAGLRGSGPPA